MPQTGDPSHDFSQYCAWVWTGVLPLSEGLSVPPRGGEGQHMSPRLWGQRTHCVGEVCVPRPEGECVWGAGWVPEPVCAKPQGVTVTLLWPWAVPGGVPQGPAPGVGWPEPMATICHLGGAVWCQPPPLLGCPCPPAPGSPPPCLAGAWSFPRDSSLGRGSRGTSSPGDPKPL